MNSWSNLEPLDSDANASYLDNLADKELPPAPRLPDIPTQLVDLATEAENPKKYIPAEAPAERATHQRVSEPLNVYEPGFRTDLYEGIVKYFREKRETRDRIDALRKKIGLRG